jgi:hypothetical protein
MTLATIFTSNMDAKRLLRPQSDDAPSRAVLLNEEMAAITTTQKIHVYTD